MYSSLKRLLAVGTAAAVAFIGFTPSTTASAAVQNDETVKAASFIVNNLPSSKKVGLEINAVLGLASTGDCSYAQPVRTLINRLDDKAYSAYVKNTAYSSKLDPARAANLSIAVSAVGLNPKKFGGMNLVSAITKNLPSSGQVGSFDSAFSQSLAIIALKRAGATVPDSIVSHLLGLQSATTGEFGYLSGGSLTGDPDMTAVAIQALRLVGGHDAAVAKAVAWAKAGQTDAGYWENYSPVDSTGLLGSTVGGAEAASALAWLKSVQHSDGGFPNALDAGTPSDLMATSEAMYLLTGTTLANATLKITQCPGNAPALPKVTSSCSGVWVVVDRGNGQYTTRCATTYTNGLTALKSAGFGVTTFASSYGAALCRISKYPGTCDQNFTSGYWSYWTSKQKDDGTWSGWTYASTGAATSQPAKGTAEGHLWMPASLGWSSTLTPSVAPPKGYAASPVPTITGTTRVGKKLTAVPGTWTPAPTKFSYRWYRNGHAISGATSVTYKLKKADKGKRISVKVTASGAGLETLARTSLRTAKVTK
jgi:hypothetical protein